LIDAKREAGDTLGGIFEVVARCIHAGARFTYRMDVKPRRAAAAGDDVNTAVKPFRIGAGSEASALRVQRFTMRSLTTTRRKNSYAKQIAPAVSRWVTTARNQIASSQTAFDAPASLRSVDIDTKQEESGV